MSQFGSRARAFFDRIFPERQIYHRSGGSVRYVSLSPGKQALLALGAVGLAGWCVYATADVLLEGPQATASNAEIERERAKYDRWLNESRAQAASSTRPPRISNRATKCSARCSTMPAARASNWPPPARSNVMARA